MTTVRAGFTAKLLHGASVLLTLAVLSSAAPVAFAQTNPATSAAAPSEASLTLPDAPGFSSSAAALNAASESSNPTPGDSPSSELQSNDPAKQESLPHRLHFATQDDMTVKPGQAAQPLSPHDKLKLGLRQSFTIFSVIGWTASAGYTQLVNGSPNYGTDSGAFGMRLGAAALSNTSHNIIGNAVLAPLFHEDPRYYKLGHRQRFLKRVVYAGTRPLITRTDSGHSSPNFALLGGNLAGAALTNLYYPEINQGLGPTAKTFGTSVGGSAVGFIVTEFLNDVLDFAHLSSFE